MDPGVNGQHQRAISSDLIYGWEIAPCVGVIVCVQWVCIQSYTVCCRKRPNNSRQQTFPFHCVFAQAFHLTQLFHNVSVCAAQTTQTLTLLYTFFPTGFNPSSVWQKSSNWMRPNPHHQTAALYWLETALLKLYLLAIFISYCVDECVSECVHIHPGLCGLWYFCIFRCSVQVFVCVRLHEDLQSHFAVSWRSWPLSYVNEIWTYTRHFICCLLWRMRGCWPSSYRPMYIWKVLIDL